MTDNRFIDAWLQMLDNDTLLLAVRGRSEVLYRLMLGLVWLHEIWHYLAARALGLYARIELERGLTHFHYEEDWQAIVVDLAPAVPGVAGMLAFATLALSSESLLPQLGWGAMSVLMVGWILAGYYDFKLVRRHVRRILDRRIRRARQRRP